MKRSTFLAALTTLLTASFSETCHAGDDKKADAARGKQGITGRVTQKKGNFLPGPAPEPGQPKPNRSVTPLQVPVHVFKGRVETFEKPDPRHPALIKTVQAGKDGMFKVALEPGEYTVVAEINGKLYLNAFTTGEAGKLIWSTVTVKAGEWATFNIEDTSKAAF